MKLEDIKALLKPFEAFGNKLPYAIFVQNERDKAFSDLMNKTPEIISQLLSQLEVAREALKQAHSRLKHLIYTSKLETEEQEAFIEIREALAELERIEKEEPIYSYAPEYTAPGKYTIIKDGEMKLEPAVLGYFGLTNGGATGVCLRGENSEPTARVVLKNVKRLLPIRPDDPTAIHKSEECDLEADLFFEVPSK
jgi:hypothetical protein